MKRIFIFSVLMIAFVMNAVAYEKGKLIERHIFRLMSPDDGDVGPNEFTIEWDGTGWWDNIRTLKSISQRGAFGSSKIQKQTYLNWFDHSARFIAQDYTAWIISKNDRQDLGFGLMNNSSEYKGIRIAGLKTGDIVRFEYYRNNADVNQFPQFESTNATHRGAAVTSGQNVYGTDDIIMNSDGDLDLRCPPRMLLRQVTITHANYKKATYSIDEVNVGGNTGYKYTITGSGVLEEKRGAVPYITMRFGHENDMTVVRDYGNGNYAASCVIDPENNLDITDPEVKLTQNYTKRYQNQNGQFVRWTADDNRYNQVGNQAEQDAVKELAKSEVNLLKGQEFTIYETSSYEWDDNKDWQLLRSRGYKWNANFEDTWPLYGTYFYFFPEVNGKLSIKFYCEGNGQHIPFWLKAQDGKVVDAYITGANNQTNKNIYELNNIDVVRGGAYYLCANPTLIEGEHPVARLISYQFVPEFRIAPLYKVVDNVEDNGSVTAACEILGGPYTELDGNVDTNEYGKYKTHKMVDDQPVEVLTDFLRNGEKAPLVECLGNIKSCVPVVRTESGHQYLDITQIKYKEGDNVNKGGAIVVNLCCDAGKGAFVLTIAYDAATAQWGKENGKDVRVGTTTEVKRWDFFTNVLDIGQYKDNQGEQYRYPTDEWKGSSTLFKEVHKYDEMTADWRITYADIQNEGIEPIFMSVYDMEGDNADMIHETAGLIFKTESNLLGIYNENDPSTSDFQDRYIGLIGKRDWNYEEHPRQLIIPFLKQGDRVVIKMGTYGNADNSIQTETATLRFTNALDAKGNPINGDYTIGGSIPYPNENATAKSLPHGEYHFQAAADGHFILEVKDAKLLKIYSIAIYRNAANNNADILTENSVTTADGPEMLFTDEDAATKDMEFYLRYSGYKEKKEFGDYNQSYTRGNLGSGTNPRLKSDGSSFTTVTSDEEPYYSVKATFNKGDFGSFRADMAVKTKDDNNTYVTDYAPGSLAVDYLKKVKDGYPYTWDFTDLLRIVNLNDNDALYINNAINTESVGSLPADYKGWNTVAGIYQMRNAPEQESGVLFANGGQLYGSNVMFEEIAGIGFKRSSENPEDAKLLNGSLEIRSGALALNSSTTDNFYKLVIPKVDANAAIYVRATPLRKTTIAKYRVSGESAADMKTVDVFNNQNDKVYVMKNGDTEKDVELWLDGMAIEKIAVATDEKTVNDEGWNTESRDHAIDPSLLPYMTGLDFRTYAVFDNPKKVDGENIIKLTRIDGVTTGDDIDNYSGNTKTIIGPATDVITNACIVRKVDSQDSQDSQDLFEKTVDGKTVKYFHLFVPDMHDTGTSDMSSNLLKAQLSATGDNKVPRQSGDFYNYAFTNKFKYVDGDGEQLKGREGVYTGKQAFYLIMASGASSAGNQAYLSLNTKVPAARLLLFFDDEEEENGEATGIATVENSVGGENARFYNLNGQQLSGKPNRSGLYIVNGKKVSIKNK